MKRILLLSLWLVVCFSYSQEKTQSNDVKVGLVLSGGGAKGFAHVSVLKVLEEAGVRVDYIGGTSMGAIVGALYASGYNANQLDSIIHTIDFTKILLDELPRKAKPFYEKEIGEKYALTLPIKNKKVGIPTAISEGQNVLNLFTKLTQHINNIEDFSKLPIPFLCVGTNLETGKQKVFKSGFLPEVIKASGSFPTLLAPVKIDGELYSDGGIVNNFPVDEVKAMGADIIIGVDIQSGLDEKEELDSAVKIINQIVGFQMYNTLKEKHDRVDVLIKPDMKNFNVVSFDKVEEIKKEGEKAVREVFPLLKNIASKQKKQKKDIVNLKLIKRFHIKRLEIEGNKNYTRSYVLGKLNIKKRDTTSYKQLLSSIDNLYATGNFENIQYRIVNEEDGSIVKFKVKEHPVSHYFQMGIHYDELYKTGVLINGKLKHLLFKNDVISTDIILGDNVRYNFDYFIDNGFYTSFGVKSRFNKFDAQVRFDEANVNKINLQYEDLTNQIYFQTVFNRKFALGVGAEHKNIRAFTETVSTVENNTNQLEDGRFYFDKSDYYNLISYLKLDTYDKKYFAKKGVYLNTSLKWHLSSSDYNNNFEPFFQLKGKIGFAYTFYDKLTTHFISEAGTTIGENENRVLDYNLGGYNDNYINNLVPFFGYEFGELTSSAFLRSTFNVRYEFLTKHYFLAGANYSRVEKDLFNKGRIFENTKSGYALGYGLETFLGPIEINYAWSPDHNEKFWYFNIGYWF